MTQLFMAPAAEQLTRLHAAVAAVAMKRVSRQFSEIMRCVAAGKKYIITNLARPLDCVAEISMSLP